LKEKKGVRRRMGVGKGPWESSGDRQDYKSAFNGLRDKNMSRVTGEYTQESRGAFRRETGSKARVEPSARTGSNKLEGLEKGDKAREDG